MNGDDMISAESWDALEASDNEQAEQRRIDRNVADRIASGEVEEPGSGYGPEDEDEQLFSDEGDLPDASMTKSFHSWLESGSLSTKASDDDCKWVTMRGTPVCIGDENNVKLGPDGVELDPDELGPDGVELGPDGTDTPKDEDLTQHPNILHNITTDPTKQDRAETLQYFKDMATFNFPKDSLMSIVFRKITTDPTSQDRANLFEMVGNAVTLKPIREFKLKPNPAHEDIKAIADVVKPVVNATVGVLWRILKSSAKGPKLDPTVVNNALKRRPQMMVRSFDGQKPDDQEVIDRITDEVLRRVKNSTDPAEIKNTIMDLMEEILVSSQSGPSDTLDMKFT